MLETLQQIHVVLLLRLLTVNDKSRLKLLIFETREISLSVLMLKRGPEELWLLDKTDLEFEFILVVEEVVDQHSLFVLSLALNLALWLNALRANEAGVSNLSWCLLVALIQVKFLVLLKKVHDRFLRGSLRVLVLIRDVAPLFETWICGLPQENFGAHK